MSNRIKLRLEMQLEAGDLIAVPQALAMALQALADRWEPLDTAPANDLLDVPRGQVAYAVEVTRG